MNACQLCGGRLERQDHPIAAVAVRGYRLHCTNCGCYNTGKEPERLRPAYLSLAEQGEAEREYAGTYGFRSVQDMDDALLRDEV